MLNKSFRVYEQVLQKSMELELQILSKKEIDK